jgi:hypothetical protein
LQISEAALSYVIHRHPNLKSLKARGCTNLLKGDSSIEKRECSFSSLHDELHAELGKKCRLEEIEFGWGFSSFSLSALEPALMSLKTINVGLGAMLGEDALRELPVICPLLETIILYFQVIIFPVDWRFFLVAKEYEKIVSINHSMENIRETLICLGTGTTIEEK